jgi:hypothetical protein
MQYRWLVGLVTMTVLAVVLAFSVAATIVCSLTEIR